jgi:hypothetical protein
LYNFDMRLRSPLSQQKIVDILKEQVDVLPSLLTGVFSGNAHRYRGTARICGIINEAGFELRNRRDPFFSVRVKGRLIGIADGTIIEISFIKPSFQDFISTKFFSRYEDDREIVLEFLREWVRASDVAV